MFRRIVIVALAVLLLLAEAFIVYRVTMRSISVEVEGDAAYLTAYGMTDEYEIGR